MAERDQKVNLYVRWDVISERVSRVCSRWAHIVNLACDLNLIVIRAMERSSAVRRCACTGLFNLRGTVLRDEASHTSRALAVTAIKVATI